MAPFITLLTALAAITNPLVQAVPVAQEVAARQQPQQQDCAAASILAQGIAENIEDQKNEKEALAEITQVLQQVPVDANAFAAAKANLLSFVSNGIAIRQANQAITPPGNKATEGLAVVANAQLEELSLTQGLTGDPVKDADAIKKLNDGFDGGLKQNQQNMMDAVAGCGITANNATQNANMGNNNNKNSNKNTNENGKDENNAKKQDAGMNADQQDAGQKDANASDDATCNV